MTIGQGNSVPPTNIGNHRVDVHCHCLPGLDDGPETESKAIELCQALVADGFTDVIATPHQLGRYDGRNNAQTVRSAVAKLQGMLDGQNVPLKIHPGGDIRIDERLPRLLQEGEISTLTDGGRYLLLELPHEFYLEPMPLLKRLLELNYIPIITHPERYSHLQRRSGMVKAWVERGALLQITAASILGGFGSHAQEISNRWIEEGLVTLVATDAHNTSGRAPRMSAALKAIEDNHGIGMARVLCIDNPARVILGERISLPGFGRS